MKTLTPSASRLFFISLASIGTLAIPFLVFLALVSFDHYTSRDRPESESEEHHVARPTPTPAAQTTEAETIRAFIDQNPNHPKLRYLISTYGQTPLTVETLKKLVVDFLTLFNKEELQPPAVEPSPPSEETPEPTKTATEAPDATAWYADAESRPFRMLARYAIFSAAAMMGALGATISVLTRDRNGSQRRLSVEQLLGLQLVGAVFACLLALFFAGGLIAGALFPETPSNADSKDGWFTVIYVYPQFAKLLVWSFLAGFSERLMPNLFQAFVEKFRHDARPEEQRPNVA